MPTTPTGSRTIRRSPLPQAWQPRGNRRANMRTKRAAATAAWFTMGLCGLLVLGAQQLPFEPAHDSGQSITGAFEGWFANPDGSLRILVGYYNRNLKQELDIPPGPNNRIEPGGPDQGQPTHFLPGRQWGVFTVTVPKDFGDKKLTWTLTANGQSTSVPFSLAPLWEVEPFKDANGNTPPVLKFEGGASVQGPKPVQVSLTGTAGAPVTLNVNASDDASLIPGMRKPRTPPVMLTWSK